jgi:hypothetical protein
MSGKTRRFAPRDHFAHGPVVTIRANHDAGTDLAHLGGLFESAHV